MKYDRHTRYLTSRADALQIPRSISLPVIQDFLKWKEKSGALFAVKRMKFVKQTILHYVADQNTILPSDCWFRKKNQHLLYGPYSWLMKQATVSSKWLQRVLTFVQLYTVEISNKELPTESEKFVQAVTSEGNDIPEEYISMMQTAGRRIKGLMSSDIKPASNYALKKPLKPHFEKRYFSEIEKFFRTSEGRSIIINYVNTVYMPLVDLLGFKGYRFSDDPPYVGKVHLIQNPGLKHRYVADGSQWLQHCLHPLGEALYNIVKIVPWDVTYYPDKHVPIIQQHLKQGKKCFCFDLSSATDRFPWELQKQVLENMSPGPIFSEAVSLYDTVVRLPFEYNGSPITWNRGQPLGIYPSFATFTLTHGLLLWGLMGFQPYKHQFFVHGDDLVILDEELAQKYSKALEDLNIPWSPDKSINSDRFAEMNSALITSDRFLPIPKWKGVNNANALDIIRLWGMNATKWVKPRYREFAKRLAQLPYPYGSGLNPDGLTIDERFEGLEDLLIPDDKILCYSGTHQKRLFSRFKATDGFAFSKQIYRLWNVAAQADKADAVDLAEDIETALPFGDKALDIFGYNWFSVNPDTNRPLQSIPKRKHTHAERLNRLYARYVNAKAEALK